MSESKLEYRFYLRPLDIDGACITHLIWSSYSMQRPILIRATEPEFKELICKMNEFGLELERIEYRELSKWNDFGIEQVKY